MLKTYRTYNPTVRFPKYEFNNKLLGGVTLLRITDFLNHWILVDPTVKKISSLILIC